MPQTQIASMFLGNPYSLDRFDRLQGVSSQLSATIHILDGQSNQGIILDYITAKNIISDLHKKSLISTLETFQFITFADKRFSEFLEKRNRLIIPDEDGSLIEFVIFEAAKYKDTEGHKAQVYAHASYLELKKASILYPGTLTGTVSQHAGMALNATGWQVGEVEGKGTRKLSIEEHTNPYEYLKQVAKEFDLELKFRVEHNGNQVTGRFVDLLERVGEWRGREVTFGKDLDGIRRVEKQDIVTALLGLGPEDENGNRLEVLVEDDEALQRWGRVDEYGNLKHLIEPYEIESTRENMSMSEARRYTRTALDKRINTQVTFEATIIDLEHITGMENKKIRFGDTIRIKDTSFNPPLYLEARIFEQSRSIKSQAKIDFKLGDFVEYTEDEVTAIFKQLQADIRKRVSIAKLEEYAEPKKIESDIAPEIKEKENPIWVDTSNVPHVPYVANSGQWQKMSPTTPQEVNAYTKQQVDNKAEQALKDAKAFSENADNIKDGVIDVGAVPLRTSATGARLEWDGVNGLVQYNQNGEPVSWIDLDANAHFANAFLSGRIEAHEGYFGKNKRAIIGDDGLTIKRPDGAVWMQDGMISSDYAISQYDPHFTTQKIYDVNGTRSGMFVDTLSGDGWYEVPFAHLDGRSSSNVTDGFRDVRDSDLGYTIRFQRYEFMHNARYLIFVYQIARNSVVGKHRARIYEVSTPPQGATEIYYDETFEEGNRGVKTLIVDMGKPTYEVRRIDFRIGHLKQWGSSDKRYRFKIPRIAQRDFI